MEGGIKALGGGLVEAFEEVPVGVEGGSDGRVSKTLLDHFRVLTLADQQGDVGVSQVMESARFSHGGTDGRQPETLAEGGSVQGAALGCVEHEVRRTGRLGGQVLGEGFDEEAGEGDRTTGGGRLGLPEYDLPADLAARLGDCGGTGQHVEVAVDVVPPATPEVVRLTVEIASESDVIGVTGVRGVTSFPVTASGGGAILHLDALPTGAETVSVRFRKGDDVWELAATANDQGIPLAVPSAETDRYPDAQAEWVLFTIQDRNGALLDAGGALIR